MIVNSKSEIRLSELFPHKDITSVKYCTLETNINGEIVFTMLDNKLDKIEVLPTKKKIRCTKNLTIMVKNATNTCWKHAVEALAKKYSLDINELKNKHHEELDIKYRELVCRLDTDVLECIILCHKKRKITRASITLAAINDELTRRVLLDDSSCRK